MRPKPPARSLGLLRVRFLLRLVACHTELAVALAVGSTSRERAGESVGARVGVQAAVAGVLLERKTRYSPGEMIGVEVPAQQQ
jgi:hypothetical protein